MPGRSRHIFIGTSGWSYNHWRGLFYPRKSSTKEWFDHYTKYFDTVEINNTFYNLPDATVFKNWQRQAPADFIYTIKANRFITHMKKLKDPEGPIRNFFSRAEYLKDHLGPILYQLPPRWKCNTERLESFLKILPKNKTHVFEFRDDSWHTEEVFEILDSYKASFCVHDMPYVKCPAIAMGKAAYLRFHGASALYRGGYSVNILKKWAKWITAQSKERKVYVYFNNDAEGHAVKDAIKLKKLYKSHPYIV